MFSSKKDPICPLLKGPCIESGCKFWTHILGKDPQTHNPIDHFDCAVAWLPILLIENSQETRQSAAATESFRNEYVRQQEDTNKSLGAIAQAAVVNTELKLIEAQNVSKEDAFQIDR